MNEDKQGIFRDRFWETSLDPDQQTQYRRMVKNPICLLDIKRKVRNGDFLLYPERLQHDCELVFENARNYNEVKTNEYKTASRMLNKKVNKLFSYEKLKQKLLKNKLELT